LSSFKHLGISKEVLKAIEDLGFTEPSEIQKKSIPILRSGTDDFIGLAQTGTGKTAAFSLPLLELLDPNSKNTQALVLAPTRELGQQIAQQIELFSKYSRGIQSIAVYGGSSIQNQMSALRKGKQIIIATPGRLIDLLNRKAVNLESIRYVVLDEADEMLNMGFKEDIDQILEYTPASKHTWLFSATMSKDIYGIVQNYMTNPQEVHIDSKNKVNVNISHCFAVVKRDDRIEVLARYLDIQENMRGLVFTRTKKEAQEVSDELLKRNYQVDSLHGDLSQAQRDRVMRRFKKHELQCLIATDVAARGIDVDDLTHVFHFNIPDDFAYYTHRSGRTARAGKKGLSILFINGRERGKFDKLSKALGIQFEALELPDRDAVYQSRIEAWAKKILSIQTNSVDSKLYGIAKSMFKEMSKEELIARLVAIEVQKLGGMASIENKGPKDKKRNDRKPGRNRNSNRQKSRGGKSSRNFNSSNKSRRKKRY